jgi:23S rRNA pseudouridine1911/1915/1917 synthase
VSPVIPAEGITRLLVVPRFHGARLDQFVAGATTLSRRAARRLMSDGLVWRNGGAVRVQSRTVEAGDVVDILRPPHELGVEREPTVVRPTFLHHDPWLLIAAKPAGVLAAPAERMAPDELAFDQQVLLALALESGRRPYLRMVHRLDRTTSGAVLFARRREALRPLTRAWNEGSVERTYLAVVEGHPELDRSVIELSITRDRSHAWRFMIDPGGQPARTRYRLVERLEDDLTLLECRLDTGRTHQVRVHLAAIGHPVLGDRLYGSRRADETGRALLHAWSLSLPHPETGDRLKILCPPPDDLLPYLPTALEPEGS